MTNLKNNFVSSSETSYLFAAESDLKICVHLCSSVAKISSLFDTEI